MKIFNSLVYNLYQDLKTHDESMKKVYNILYDKKQNIDVPKLFIVDLSYYKRYNT